MNKILNLDFWQRCLNCFSLVVLAQDNISIYIIHRFKFSRDITVSTSIMIMKMNERPSTTGCCKSSSFFKISLFIFLFNHRRNIGNTVIIYLLLNIIKQIDQKIEKIWLIIIALSFFYTLIIQLKFRLFLFPKPKI